MEAPLINADREAVSPAEERKQKPVLFALFLVGYAVAIQFLVAVGTSVIVFVLLGRYTDEATMAAFGLGNTLCNLCGRFILLGVACGLDTLASQAWGANEPQKAGLYAQRAALILLVLVCLPLSVAWWYASPILVALGQPTLVADKTSSFARIAIPGLFSQALSITGSKLFLALGKSRPVMLVSLFAQVIQITLLIGLIVHPWRLGLLGAAIATTTSNVVQPFCFLALALRDAKMRSCWPGLTRACLRGWGSYLRLGAPACFMLLAEALSWDLVSFLAGLCDTATGAGTEGPPAVLAAQGLLQSTIALCYCIPMGISRAGSTVIGNAVGAKDARRAAHAARLCLGLGIGTSAGLVAALTLFRGEVVALYGAPAAVGDIVRTMIPYVSGASARLDPPDSGPPCYHATFPPLLPCSPGVDWIEPLFCSLPLRRLPADEPDRRDRRRRQAERHRPYSRRCVLADRFASGGRRCLPSAMGWAAAWAPRPVDWYDSRRVHSLHLIPCPRLLWWVALPRWPRRAVGPGGRAGGRASRGRRVATSCSCRYTRRDGG